MNTTASDVSLEAAASDRRVAPRRRVMKGAKITFGDFIYVRDCSVRDISETGARISVVGASEIPKEFYLVLMTERSMRKVHVAWRKGDTLGIIFEGEAENLALNKDPRLKQFCP
jgi:hypothetical protein